MTSIEIFCDCMYLLVKVISPQMTYNSFLFKIFSLLLFFSQSEGEYRYGDLLQSINRSHHDIQSHLLQGGLSPITPAEPSAGKPWPHQGIAVPLSTHPPHMNMSHMSSVTHATSVPLLSVAQGVSISEYNISLSQAPILSEALAGRTGNIQTPSRTSVPTTGQSMGQLKGFTPVVLPSGGHRSRSPHRSSKAPVQTSFISTAKNVEYPAVSHCNQATIKQERRYPDKDVTTQPGPPNVTISTYTTLPAQEKPVPVQKLPRNPFTFPATPPVSLTNEKPIISKSNLIVSDGLSEKQRHSSDEMPQLSPVARAKQDIKDEPIEDDLVPLVSLLSINNTLFKYYFYHISYSGMSIFMYSETQMNTSILKAKC